VTQRTGMGPVERLRDRFAQRCALHILHDHCRPCERLKRNPLQSDGAAKRDYGNEATNSAEHAVEPRDAIPTGQATEIRRADPGGRKLQPRLWTRIYNSNQREQCFLRSQFP
jgi:hypothetical protein